MIRSRKKQPKWKKEQKKKKAQEKKSRVILGIFFLISIFLLVMGGILWKKTKNSIWDGKSNISIVYQDDNRIRLKILLTETNKVILFNIPKTTLVQAGFGYGEYQLKNIYKLGNLEGYGGKVLSRAISDLLGINIKGFAVKKDTNLTWWDKWRVLWFEKLTAKKKGVFDLGKHEAFNKEKTSGGIEVFRVSDILIDEFVNREMFDERLVNESLSMAVLNASGVEEMAKNVSRIISNAGGEVRLVSNLENKDNSKILIADKKNKDAFTIKFLKSIVLVNEIEIADIIEYRSDIVLIIGKDYTNLK